MDSNAKQYTLYSAAYFLYARCNLYSRGGAVQPFSLQDTFSEGMERVEEERREVGRILTEPSSCVYFLFSIQFISRLSSTADAFMAVPVTRR